MEKNVCGVLKAYLEYTSREKKPKEREFESSFEDYRKINVEKKDDYNKNQLSTVTNNEKLQKFNLTDVQLDFDATSLNSSAIWD